MANPLNSEQRAGAALLAACKRVIFARIGREKADAELEAAHRDFDLAEKEYREAVIGR